jgi:hypothetical protein
MSGTDQLIDIRADEPEFYAELLSKIPRPANRRLQPSGEQSCSDIPDIQDFDFALSRRLQTRLDAVADISLCQRGNVSATMVSLKHYAVTDTLETKLYIVFNHENDDSAGYCDQHLQNIFTMLREVPDKTPETGGSPKDIADKLEDDCIGICTEIHNYSFDIFHHRVIKREGWLVNIRGYIEQDQTKFTDQERSTLLLFLVASI